MGALKVDELSSAGSCVARGTNPGGSSSGLPVNDLSARQFLNTSGRVGIMRASEENDLSVSAQDSI